MGDDTWMSVFPDTFEQNMTFPFDSFNVEDLHSVDEGVIKHLFPLLEDKSKPFDFLIGHFLGVDHVGHRVGPDHPSMKAKLRQMNHVLESVVSLLEDDTLLVVLGDHGMDRSGDHGGDGTLETSSALWVFSKGPALTVTSSPLPSGLLQYKTFPAMSAPHRSVQQIDILPTLSLILGLPIPYNNLGTVIPEIFWRDEGKMLEQALELNSRQIKRYLDTYRSSPSGGELDDAWLSLESSWSSTQAKTLRDAAKLITLTNYNRVALGACRAIWAQFNPVLMSLGLVLIGMGICAAWSVYSGLSASKHGWDDWLAAQLPLLLRGAAGGAAVGIAVSLAFSSYFPGFGAFDFALFTTSLISCMVLIVSSPPTITWETLKATPVILILHTVAYFSNSFTFWEDRIVHVLIVSSTVPKAITGFTAPTSRLRHRILGFSLLLAVCVRLIAISTICREEQQPYCHVTFFASSSIPSPPLTALYLIIPASLALPWMIWRFLRITRSEMGLAKMYLPLILMPSLLAGSAYWILEWADSADILGSNWTTLLRVGRTWIARFTFGWILIVGGGFWWLVPVCLNVEVQEPTQGEKRQIKIMGFANAFGAPYLLFWTVSLVIVYITTQITGQLVLVLAVVAVLAYLEVLDSVRDVQIIAAAFEASVPSTILDPTASVGQSPPIKFTDIIPLALLGLHVFYGTGHQAIISSIQWKSAFLLTSTVTYPFSPLTVVANSFGPLFLMALAAPLLALWNRAPLAEGGSEEKPDVQVKGESTLAALGMMIYYTTLMLGTAVSAAILRRHLMVWKVFAPRFMAGVLSVLAVDLAVLVGIGIGVERVTSKVARMFRRRPGVGDK